jgi:hypothetical protein
MTFSQDSPVHAYPPHISRPLHGSSYREHISVLQRAPEKGCFSSTQKARYNSERNAVRHKQRLYARFFTMWDEQTVSAGEYI